MEIPFNIPFTCSDSAVNVKYLSDKPVAIAQKSFTKACERWFQDQYKGYNAILTTSCTRVMELIALSMDIKPGDEIIMPSYSYVGVANAFANIGAKLVFVDIDPITMNIDVDSIEAAITDKTRAILVMHYSGVACHMEQILAICHSHNIILIEDNAQGLGATYQNKLLGSFGDFAGISFDSMKNITCGEGGILLYKKMYKHQLDICFENGTDKQDFIENKVDSYQWVERGSNFAISEYNAAILLPLLEQYTDIVSMRRKKWQQLYDSLARHGNLHRFLSPYILKYDHSAHLFFLKARDKRERDQLIRHLQSYHIASYFHYTPLHTSKNAMRQNFHMLAGDNTIIESDRLLRLPIFNALTDEQIEYMTSVILNFDLYSIKY